MLEKILIVDDERSILNSLKGILEDENYAVQTAGSAFEAIKLMEADQRNSFQAAFVDIWMDKMDGLELLEWMQAKIPKLPVIIMSGHGSIETAVKAVKKGAYDFIEKPLSLEKVLIVLQHALQELYLRQENEELRKKGQKPYEIIGDSVEIKSMMEQLERAAPSEGWVLISGENGTGKELVAKQIHFRSLRKNKPFVELNCAAIPEDLIESELFGYEKGAFAGATKQKPGKFDQANFGTLFLDEIGDMSLKMQAKILRVLQEQKYERIGGDEIIEADIRIITASNKNLQEEIKLGHFREDLYYRLNVIPIDLPPLRERKGDIPALVDHFLDQFCKNEQRKRKEVGAEAMDSLISYNWPGNIRELKNIVERMVIMVKDPVLELKHVPPVIRLSNSEMMQINYLPGALSKAVKAFEKKFIETQLKKNIWNISDTATSIKIERGTLQKKIKTLKISVPD
ncbi:MAG: sigma-54-dependent Fis family transcriptional regulator [Proteobacteria bacterium]|nr:sigma-54-dependent Fis family transcriptional regulator [Pseudomonadota bacterium]